MKDIRSCFQQLNTEIVELEQKFLARHIPAKAEADPIEYKLDVRAYCIMAHAVFEEYLETVAFEAMDRAIDEWMHNRKTRETLILLPLTFGIKLKIEDVENKSQDNIFDSLRNIFMDAKSEFSKQLNNNHGISVKYLRSLFIPVGIDVPSDINIISSVKQLSKERGEYAHSYAAARVLAPEDAQKYVGDCINLCKEIHDSFLILFP